MTGDGVVTVCIPAYQAAAFIDRTLRCAREQTYPAQRILVSVDQSDDATEEICRRHAAEDDRVEVHAHRERQGWAGNLNYLLAQAGTEFHFFYMHDDLIDPTYSERLVAALRHRPDATSAHCVVRYFGASESTSPGRSYDGSAAHRLLTFLVAPWRGALLRSMVRTDAAANLTLPTNAAGIWADEVFGMKLVAAGPAVHVPEELYRQEMLREGGLTAGWLTLPFEDILRGYRTNATMALEIVDSVHPTPEDRECLLFALFVFIAVQIRAREVQHEAPLTALEHVLPELARDATPPAALHGLPRELRELCEERYEHLLHQTGRRALQLRDRRAARAAYWALVRRNPARVKSWGRLVQAVAGIR